MAYGPEAIEKTRYVVHAIVGGATLKEALNDIGLHASTFHEVLGGVRELAVSYARAQEICSDFDVDDALKIADDASIDPQRAKNMIDIRKWRASKRYARLYGERIDLNVQQNISVSDALTEARRRVLDLRPMRDQEQIDDAVIIETLPINEAKPSDDVSDSAASDVPDIFS